jgi:hypothetical protein
MHAISNGMAPSAARASCTDIFPAIEAFGLTGQDAVAGLCCFCLMQLGFHDQPRKPMKPFVKKPSASSAGEMNWLKMINPFLTFKTPILAPA